MLEHILVDARCLHAGQKTYPVRVGRAGFTADKHEGDLKTPVGTFPMRELFYRPDRFTSAPLTLLRATPLHPHDGWCDDPSHAAYNRAVTLPFSARHEKLWRDDHVYDLIVPLGYNDRPIIPGRGSAIFMHLMRDDGVGTEGCVALKRTDLLELLAQCSAETMVEIRG